MRWFKRDVKELTVEELDQRLQDLWAEYELLREEIKPRGRHAG